MTTAQKGILRENTYLLEALLELIEKKDQSIFDLDTNDAVLYAIVSLKVLTASINREEERNKLINNYLKN